MYLLMYIPFLLCTVPPTQFGGLDAPTRRRANNAAFDRRRAQRAQLWIPLQLHPMQKSHFSHFSAAAPLARRKKRSPCEKSSIRSWGNSSSAKNSFQLSAHGTKNQTRDWKGGNGYGALLCSVPCCTVVRYWYLIEDRTWKRELAAKMSARKTLSSSVLQSA